MTPLKTSLKAVSQNKPEDCVPDLGLKQEERRKGAAMWALHC